MSMDVIFSLVRQVLLLGGGIAVSKGVVDDATAQTVIGAVVTAASSIWSFWTAHQTHELKK